jgi:signal transduction histidine kinase
LQKQDGKTVIFDRKLSGQEVSPMLEDHSGAVWLGVDLTLMRFQNGRFREIGGQSFASFGGVTAIAEDSGGTIWVLTPRGQLFSIVGDKIKKQASLNYELGQQKYLVADPNGGLWLGAPKGTISYFRDGRLQTTSLSSPQGPVDINVPFVDSDNSLLVPSSQGLYRLNHGQVTLFSSDNGLPCPETFNAIRDNHGALWIYTRCGMVRIAEPEWAKWIESPHVAVSVMILDALDGAQAGTGDSWQPASSKAPDGRLWFETGVSVQVLDPDRLYENPLPPPVYVGGVVADRKRFDATSLVKVPALSRDLEIDYTAPSFSVPQKVRFRYMLEGRDREWQDAGPRRQAFYTDLKPGHYRFRVTACNSQGVWNQTGASLDFSIAPAYWQTNWFRAACVAAFMVLLWMLYRMRLRRLAREFTAGLEARVNERTRIARELHDSLLQGFQGLMFRLQAVRDLLPGRASEAMQALDIALERGDKAIAEGRDTVSGLREPIMGDSDIAQALTALGKELAQQSGNGLVPCVRVLLEGKQRELNPMLRDEIYRIAREALRNAFLHARAQKIEAEITYSDSEFLLRVRDDGGGIDPEIADQGARAGHWGLPGMRERAKSFGGKLEVWSEHGAGTEIELSVPGAIAYGKSEPRRRFGLWRKKIGESDGQQS